MAEAEDSWGGLSPQDRRALERYVESTLGHGFRLAIVEAAAPWQRTQIMAGLRPLLLGQPLREVALQDLPGDNLWQELTAQWTSTPGQGVLALWGLEEAGARTEVLMRQLNVQRDLFVRDLRVPWVLFVHPGLSTRLQMQAPDFCDVAILWVRAGEETLDLIEVDLAPNDICLSPAEAPSDSAKPTLLAQAREALNRRDLDQARDLLARFMLLGQASQAERLEAVILSGWLTWMQGNIASARALLQRAISEAGTDERMLRGMAVYFLGALEATQGNYAAARQLLSEAAQIAEESGRPRDQTLAKTQLAEIEARLGNFDGMRLLIHDVMSRGEKASDRRGFAGMLRTLGMDELRRRNDDEAWRLGSEALRIGIDISDQQGRAASLRLLGLVARRRRRYDEARRVLSEAIQLVSDIGDRHGRAVLLSELAQTELRDGKIEEARRLFQESIKISTAAGLRHERAISLLLLGQIEAKYGRLQEGRAMLREAVATLVELHAAEAPEAERILVLIDNPPPPSPTMAGH